MTVKLLMTDIHTQERVVLMARNNNSLNPCGQERRVTGGPHVLLLPVRA